MCWYEQVYWIVVCVLLNNAYISIRITSLSMMLINLHLIMLLLTDQIVDIYDAKLFLYLVRFLFLSETKLITAWPCIKQSRTMNYLFLRYETHYIVTILLYLQLK